ncbi:TPA: glucosamine-6-phosphate deaminase [Morganella morganii]|uniref:glucosamine-6-phosphate deaminase n=1 Tax=Morganella morganii TaxID=582 RepID=UPI001A1D0012|nr:glucosamine-6-phosphate deaminase [Morganella morganii]MCU6212008.1 glucosamine-6-phosphate deaminase [Morganella morganii]HAT1514115.1 glucosamine-6-phosphate deaminase [Morganella morganii]
MTDSLVTAGQKDLLHYAVYANRDAMGRAAAEKARDIIVQCQASQPEVRIIFASAPSQNEFLQHLQTFPEIDWSKVTAFHMDEYIGLPPGAPQAFSHYIQEHLFDTVKPAATHFIRAHATDSDAECCRYAGLLSAAPVDLVCLGVGENGHIAFNDPWVADFSDSAVVKRVQLDEQCRQQQVNDGCFARTDDVPMYALTLTIPALVSARHMVCVVPAATKRQAVTRMIRDPISEDLPATILRRHNSAFLYLDKDSGADLC